MIVGFGGDLEKSTYQLNSKHPPVYGVRRAGDGTFLVLRTDFAPNPVYSLVDSAGVVLCTFRTDVSPLRADAAYVPVVMDAGHLWQTAIDSLDVPHVTRHSVPSECSDRR